MIALFVPNILNGQTEMIANQVSQKLILEKDVFIHAFTEDSLLKDYNEEKHNFQLLQNIELKLNTSWR